MIFSLGFPVSKHIRHIYTDSLYFPFVQTFIQYLSTGCPVKKHTNYICRERLPV